MIFTRWLNGVAGRLQSRRTPLAHRRPVVAAQVSSCSAAMTAEALEPRRLLTLPVIGGLNGDSLAYSGNTAVVIDQGASASVTGTIAIGGTLTVSITSGGDASEDVLSIRNAGTGLGQLGVSGSSITYSGLPLGTFTGGSSGSNLVVTFNAISLVAIGDLLQNITYQNLDAVSPTAGTRNIQFSINDGLGSLSAPVSATVDVLSSLSTSVSGGTLQLGSTPAGATLTLSRSGANLRVTDPANLLSAGLGVLSIDSHTIEVPLANLTNGILINGGSGAEFVNVDFSGGTPIPLGGLTFSGGAGIGDALNLDNVSAAGSGGFSSAVYMYSASDTGGVILDADGNAATTGDRMTVSFSGLESLSNDGVSANVSFNLPATSNANLSLADQGAGVTRLNLSGSTTVDFASPAANGSLTLNLGTNNQTLTVSSLALPTGADLIVNGDSADTINLNASGLNVTGDLSLTAGAIAQSQPVVVAGLTTLTAGPNGNITLDNAGNDFATVAVASALNATLSDINGIDLGASSVTGMLNVSANGTITDSGALSVGGSASLAAGAANDITLNAANEFAGAVSIVSGNDVTLNDINSLDLGGSTISGDLSLTTNGAISDSGNLSVAGTATLSAGAGNGITLNSVGNDFATVAIGSALNVALVDANAIELGNSTVAGALTITSSGNITDSGNVSVIGNANFAAASGNITLGDAIGETTNFGSLTFNTTGTVSIAEDSNTSLSGTSTANSLTLTSSNAISDAMAASLTIASNARLSGLSITLGDQATDTTNFGSLSFSSLGAVAITEDSAMNVGGTAASSSGTLTLVSQAGSITIEDTGAATDLSATGAITFNVASNEQTFTLNSGSVVTTTSGGVVVLADDMNLQGMISAAGQTVSLRSSVGADAINLGVATDAAANTLELSDAELDRITAGTITIGDSAAGSVMISAPINRALATNVSITTGSNGGITFAAGSLDASGGNVTLTTGSGGVVSGSLTTDVSAASLNITAGAAIGASGNSLTTAVTNLVTDTSATNANQFLSEADSTLVALNAGSGTIALSSGTFTLSGSEVINNNSDVTIASPAVLNLGGFGETLDALSGSGMVTDSVVGAVTLTVGANGDSSTFNGVIQNGSGTVGLTKIGTGTLTLTGANTFTSATTVNAGTLLIDGSTAASSAVSVSGSAVLGGTGTIGGPITLSAGSAATLSPGSPISATADLANGTLTLNAGTTLAVQVNGAMAGALHDQVLVNGLVSLGNATLSLAGAITSNAGQQIVLIANDGADAVVGAFNGLIEGAAVTINGVSFALSYRGGAGGNDVTLTQAGPATFNSDGVGVGVLQLRLNGGNVEFVDDGVVVDSRPAATVLNQTLTVNGASGGSLTVDYSQGFFDADVVWHGTNGGLSIVGGTFATGSETFTTAGPGASGTVVLSNAAVTATISYDGTSSVNLAGTSIGNLILNLPNGTNAVVLENSGTSNDGVSRLRSLGGTFATTTFASPSGSLTINGGTGSDAVEVASLDSTFAGTLAINFGAGSDTLRGTLVDAVTLTNSDANGFDGTEASATTSFSDVETIIGNGGTLTGQNTASTWTLNGSASTYSNGSRSLTLNGFTTLQGGSAADAFRVIGNSTFVLLGGDGDDSFGIDANLNGIADGQNGNDTLDASGSTRGATLFGNAGADSLIGGMFDDSLDGGADNDVLMGNSGNDSLIGGTGGDTANGGSGTDTLFDNVSGNVTLSNTALTGAEGGANSNVERFVLIGSDANDRLDATAYTLGPVTLRGLGGNDTLIGSASGGDLLDGGEDDDFTFVNKPTATSAMTVIINGNETSGTLSVNGVSDNLASIESVSVMSGSGRDTLDGSAYFGTVTLLGNGGDDVIRGSQRGGVLNGMAGNDSIVGGNGDETILGGANNDTLFGNGGNDVIKGQAHTDSIDGGSGDDTLYGEGDAANNPAGNDTVKGGDGDDWLDGGAGNDRLDGDAGYDTLLGQAGRDRLSGGDDDDSLNGGADNDTLLGGAGHDMLTAGAGNDLADGGDGDDSVDGQGGTDTVLGGAGHDSLFGGAGNDIVLGGDGDDSIWGNEGKDTLAGQSGDDDRLFDAELNEINEAFAMDQRWLLV